MAGRSLTLTYIAKDGHTWRRVFQTVYAWEHDPIAGVLRITCGITTYHIMTNWIMEWEICDN